jgi:hypothetical protein
MLQFSYCFTSYQSFPPVIYGMSLLLTKSDKYNIQICYQKCMPVTLHYTNLVQDYMNNQRHHYGQILLHITWFHRSRCSVPQTDKIHHHLQHLHWWILCQATSPICRGRRWWYQWKWQWLWQFNIFKVPDTPSVSYM